MSDQSGISAYLIKVEASQQQVFLQSMQEQHAILCRSLGDSYVWTVEVSPFIEETYGRVQRYLVVFFQQEGLEEILDAEDTIVDYIDLLTL